MQVLAWPNASKNPYTPLLYAQMGLDVSVYEFSARRIFQRYSIWHIHWPESLLNIRNTPWAAYKLAGFFASIDYLRWRGTKIIWTIHNFKSHEDLHPTLEAYFWREFIPRVDGAISLSGTGLSIAKKFFPRLEEIPTTVIPHGHYRDEYPQCAVDPRKSLEIPLGAKVLLFFGAIRAYKNVDALVRAFRSVPDPDALLYIVGSPNSSALAKTILREAASDSRVRLMFGFVKSEDVSRFIQAADIVVLPYRRILNSGSALLALSFNRAVLVPDLGSMGDLEHDFGKSWVQRFSGELDSNVLERALAWIPQPRPSICSMPDKYSWHSIRSETIRFYERVVSGER